VIHLASSEFWKLYNSLPENIKFVAKNKFELLKLNPRHPSLHLKKVNQYWSVRITLLYRAIGINLPDKNGIFKNMKI